ncbi:MAG: methyltransferase domain-containing protein [Clostridia bacterium]|nr:methyltransferase domain-containing protein [Clostridia bacterium]
MSFVCPVCHGELESFGNMKKCPRGHSFDRAKEGYYNLLLSKKGGMHGDNAEMVRARRAFLERGYYEPLAERVAERVLELTPRGGTVLDAGLGEGYYTDRVERALALRDGTSRVHGFDISKTAVRYAAKKNPRLSLAVASSYDIPAADASFNTVISIFSPLAREEIHRVLSTHGTFVFAYPGRRHLMGLKSAIYDLPRENEPDAAELAGFELIASDRLNYTVTVNGADAVRELFMMTPYAYRTGAAERDRLYALSSVSTEIEFCVDVYRKLFK